MEQYYRYVVQMAGESKPYKNYWPGEFFDALSKKLTFGDGGIFWTFRDNIAYLQSPNDLSEILKSLDVWVMNANTSELVR